MTVSTRNTDGLRAAARTKTEATALKVDAAIRRMRKSGDPINISTVAKEAGVSRTYLQRQPDIRERIRLLSSVPSTPPPAPAAGSDNAVIAALRNSLRAQDERHRKEVAALRVDNKRLETALAKAYGKLIQDGSAEPNGYTSEP